MDENTYVSDILNGLGFAINESNNREILVNYPIKPDKKNMRFIISSTYKINIQPLGSFLADQVILVILKEKYMNS